MARKNGDHRSRKGEVGRPNTRYLTILGGIVFFFLLQTIVWVGKLPAQEILRVGVLPFRVHAGEAGKFSTWQQEIVQSLSAELSKEERITLVPTEELEKAIAEGCPEEIDEKCLREKGRDLDADFMISGSATQVDGSISLDARIIEVQGPSAYSSFAVAQGGEELGNAVRQLAREASIKILRKERVAKVLIEGNRVIEKNAILSQIKTKEGEIFSPTTLREDIKNIYRMGYFQDVRAEKRDWGRGTAIVYVVEEKSVIKEIKFSGTKQLKNKDLLEAISIKPRTILDLNLLKESVNKIEKKYREEGYYLAKVKYELEKSSKGDVNVRFVIEENKKIRITDITFTGNAHFSDEQLRKILPNTKEKGWFAYIRKTGIYKEDVLEHDLDAVLAFYYQKGFYQAHLGKPQVVYDQKGIQITIPVDEGPQFKVGKVDIGGDLIAPKEELFKKVSLREGDVLNRDKVRSSVSNLTDMYADEGYAFVDVEPQTVIHRENNLADLNIVIHKGSKVYFERINIMGNTKTRDRVIRRDLPPEGRLYSLSALKTSREKLNKLGYFKEVNLSTKKGSADDKLDLDIQVQEGPTGMFSIGGGYSTVDKLVATFSIAQNNFLGRGERLSVGAQIGTVSQYYNIIFTEPRIFDSRVSNITDLHHITRDYYSGNIVAYSVTRTGGALNFGFPLIEQLRIIPLYRYDQLNVFNVLPTASSIILAQQGLSTTSAVGLNFRRDTRNHYFDPSKGSDSYLYVEFAGSFLGGSNDFMKYIANSAWYYTPFDWKLTFMAHGRIGYIWSYGGTNVPLPERFFLGGMNSIRGFKAFTVGPQDSTGANMGGDKELLFNLETIFPLIPQLKIKGVLFFDSGNVFDFGEPMSLNLRSSTGIEFRWISPVGPLRISFAYVLNPYPGGSQTGWDFSMGTIF